MSRPPHLTPEATAGAHVPEAALEYPELLEPITCSWPVLETSLHRAGRLPSPRAGRWAKGLLVKMALLWLSVSLGLVAARTACDDFMRSRRRAHA